jgi:hypothetical protein
MNPFIFVRAINTSKKDVMEDEKDYNAFMVNRSLSYFPDTVIYANEMNQHAHLDNRLQFDFLINIIRKRKRFSKWNKASESNDIRAVKEYYGYSNEKARDVLPLLSKNELKFIKEKIDHGGTKR